MLKTHRQNGLTIIELLVTIAILAILASFAAPSFTGLLQRRSVQTAAESLVSDMRLARSEALKRSTRTFICRSTDSTTCAGGAGNWADGWIVFVDVDASGNNNTGDDLVRVQQKLPNVASIQNAVFAATIPLVRFNPNGRASGATESFVFTPAGTLAGSGTRLVCISSQGRPALRVEGATACN